MLLLLLYNKQTFFWKLTSEKQLKTFALTTEISNLQEECELPQMHMLSIAMEPILHKNCPPNCQDILAWLPHHVAIHVLSFLDLGNKN